MSERPLEIDLQPKRRLSFEIAFPIAGILFGVLLLPLLVYAVGVLLFGTYPGGAGRLGSFYGAFMRDLASGQPRVWMLAVGPLLLIYLLRILLPRRHIKSPPGDSPSPPDGR